MIFGIKVSEWHVWDYQILILGIKKREYLVYYLKAVKIPFLRWICTFWSEAAGQTNIFY